MYETTHWKGVEGALPRIAVFCLVAVLFPTGARLVAAQDRLFECKVISGVELDENGHLTPGLVTEFWMGTNVYFDEKTGLMRMGATGALQMQILEQGRGAVFAIRRLSQNPLVLGYQLRIRPSEPSAPFMLVDFTFDVALSGPCVEKR